MKGPNEQSEILTIRDVAAYLKVTDRTIYRLAGANKIPAFKVGGTWRFSRGDIDGWIKQQSAAKPVRTKPVRSKTGGRK